MMYVWYFLAVLILTTHSLALHRCCSLSFLFLDLHSLSLRSLLLTNYTATFACIVASPAPFLHAPIHGFKAHTDSIVLSLALNSSHNACDHSRLDLCLPASTLAREEIEPSVQRVHSCMSIADKSRQLPARCQIHCNDTTLHPHNNDTIRCNTLYKQCPVHSFGRLLMLTLMLALLFPHLLFSFSSSFLSSNFFFLDLLHESPPTCLFSTTQTSLPGLLLRSLRVLFLFSISSLFCFTVLVSFCFLTLGKASCASQFLPQVHSLLLPGDR